MSFRRVLRSNAIFCLGLATAMLATRIIAFDANTLFKLRFIPNHDMSGAVPFFVTNAHAVRTTGDIAWWNPVSYSGHGYPQYYQSFLSPLAPTCGHIVMIAWMQMIRALAAIGVTIPEYEQYLAITYGVLPFLTFFSFSVFNSLIFRRRSTVVLVGAAYAFSGIGLWNSAWFYFQESFTLFFLLAAWLAALRRPTLARGLVLVAAVLVQVSSINYWTIYNSWFVLIFLGSHAWIYRNRVVRAYARLCRWIAEHRSATVGLIGLFAAIAGPWLLIVGSIAREQGTAHVRPYRDHLYTTEIAYGKVPETRWITGGLFNPSLDRTLGPTPIINQIHDARYIGLAFLPLLALLPLVVWKRRERWLAVSAAGILCVCIAPPILLAAWKATPGMDRVLHLFYFYTHYWQILLVLLAGAVFDRFVGMPLLITRRGIVPAIVSATAVAGLALLLIGQFSQQSVGGERIGRGGLLLATTGGLLALVRHVPRPGWRLLCVWLFVFVGTGDLVRYFAEASRADHQFTRKHWRNVPYPLPPDVVARLRQRWQAADPSAGFSGGLAANLPIASEFWPDNHFLVSRNLWPVWSAPCGGDIVAAEPSAVLFYRSAETVAANADWSADVDGDAERFYRPLVLHGGVPIPNSIADDPDAGPVAVPHRFTHWGYSDFALAVDAPAKGWLLLHQLYDPLWHIRIDGCDVTCLRANQFRMAVAIPPGRHTLEMSYRPFARGLYWPACWLLETGLAFLGIAAWRARRPSRLRLSGSAWPAHYKSLAA